MKLKNKKTGEIGYPYFQNWMEISCTIVDENAIKIAEYKSLAELNEEWEDAPEEPKEYWCIDWTEPGIYKTSYEDERDDFNKEIGNYFDTREEAEKAVEKLKAWKRLKDKGFRFMHNKVIGEYGNVSYRLNYPICAVEEKDLDLLFGGEE